MIILRFLGYRFKSGMPLIFLNGGSLEITSTVPVKNSSTGFSIHLKQGKFPTFNTILFSAARLLIKYTILICFNFKTMLNFF